MADMDDRPRTPVRRVDDWIRWGVGGLIAGLIAYGGIGSRISALETEVHLTSSQASEDRRELRSQFNALTTQVQELTIRIEQERRDREQDARDRRLGPGAPGSGLSPGRMFDR